MPKSQKDVEFVSSPSALTEISLAITKCIGQGYLLVIIDSLSTFMIYHKPEILNRFLHSLSNKIREAEGELILTTSIEDKNSDVFRKVSVLMDKTLSLK